jgi:hypothetical protein
MIEYDSKNNIIWNKAHTNLWSFKSFKV